MREVAAETTYQSFPFSTIQASLGRGRMCTEGTVKEWFHSTYNSSKTFSSSFQHSLPIGLLNNTLFGIYAKLWWQDAVESDQPPASNL